MPLVEALAHSRLVLKRLHSHIDKEFDRDAEAIRRLSRLTKWFSIARRLDVAIASVLMASYRRTALLLLQVEAGKLRLEGVVGPMQRGRDAIRCDKRQNLRRSDDYTGKSATITDYSDRTIRGK